MRVPAIVVHNRTMVAVATAARHRAIVVQVRVMVGDRIAVRHRAMVAQPRATAADPTAGLCRPTAAAVVVRWVLTAAEVERLLTVAAEVDLADSGVEGDMPRLPAAAAAAVVAAVVTAEGDKFNDFARRSRNAVLLSDGFPF